jgi:hypothetical protein
MKRTVARLDRVVRGTVAALLAVALLGRAPVALRAQSAVGWQWHGYGQFRYSRAPASVGFALRRGKLWLQGSVPALENVSFKVQGSFRNSAAGSIVLQDFFVQYQGSFGRLRLGQMVPAFSLQRSQPDFLVPLVERAGVVDALIPGAKTLARDIGAQIFLGSTTGPVHLSAGVFNGSGANRASGKEGSFLATTRLTYTHGLSSGVTGAAGVSGAYRRAAGTAVGILSTAGTAFSGKDIRWGVEAHVLGEGWEVQGEYLEGHLKDESSRGFYLLGDYAVSSANQIVLSAERLQTPGSGDEPPSYIVGFNRCFSASGARGAGHARIPDGSSGVLPDRLMADVRLRHAETGMEYGAEVQLQLFLH